METCTNKNYKRDVTTIKDKFYSPPRYFNILKLKCLQAIIKYINVVFVLGAFRGNLEVFKVKKYPYSKLIVKREALEKYIWPFVCLRRRPVARIFHGGVRIPQEPGPNN